MEPSGEGAGMHEPRYSAMETRLNAYWVDATIHDFVTKLRHEPVTKRSAKVRSYLDDELPELRDMIRAQWSLGDGWSLSEYGDIQNNYVYEALERLEIWRLKLEDKARVDEASTAAYLARVGEADENGESNPRTGSSSEHNDSTSPFNPVESSDTRQPTLSKEGSSGEDGSFESPSLVQNVDTSQSTLPQQDSKLGNADGPISGASSLPTPKPSSP
ncbi:hypothetical protein PG993_001727 [Apiospora rasikravindrae]|uniref:Uncharacterized protein n=1 Tax=Apiospora rasikravindrae TaxID=990691 RepID=A0ABR1UC91_9PEZI